MHQLTKSDDTPAALSLVSVKIENNFTLDGVVFVAPSDAQAMASYLRSIADQLDAETVRH